MVIGYSNEKSIKKLKDVVLINPKISEDFEEQFIYIDLESVNTGKLSKINLIMNNEKPSRAQRILKNGDIIFQLVRPYQKNNLLFSDVYTHQVVASTGYAVLRSKDVYNEYLYQLILSNGFINKILIRCTGSNYPAINTVDLSNINIKIHDMENQKKIGNLLSQIDNLIGIRKKKVDALFLGFSKLLDLTYLYLDSTLTHKNLETISFITMGQSPKSTEYNNIGIGKPLVQGNADINNRKTKPRVFSKTGSKECHVDDIIMSVRAPVGHVAISDGNYYIGRGVCSIKSKISKYVYYFLMWKESKWQEVSTGSTFDSVNSREINNLKVPIYCKHKMKKNSILLSSMDKLIEIEEQKLKELELMKKYYLQQIFD